MMLLRTIGIITPTNISFTYGVVDKQGVFIFIQAENALLVSKQPGCSPLKFDVAPFTTTGAELISLVSISSNIEFMKTVGSHIKSDGINARLGKITSFEGSPIKFRHLANI